MDDDQSVLSLTHTSKVFLCEIMSPSRRGLGAAMYSVLHSVGFFLVLILGAFLPWRWAVSVPAFLAVPAFMAIAFLHESPEWLNKTGHEQQCQESLKFYQKDLESSRIKTTKKDTADKKHLVTTTNLLVLIKRFKTFMHLVILQDPYFLRNLLYLSTLFVCIGWCGFSILSFYAVEIFKLSGSPLPALDTP